MVLEFAFREAVQRGFLEWPPPISVVSAIEAKAQYFDMEAGLHRATKSGRAPGIKKQVQGLTRMGFDRVSFLHFVVTKPVNVAGVNPWMAAGAISGKAEEAYKPLFDLEAGSPEGYTAAFLGAIPHKEEHLAGAGPRVVTIKEPRARHDEGSYRKELLGGVHKLLGLLPRPNFFPVVIRWCRACKKPLLSSTLDVQCAVHG